MNLTRLFIVSCSLGSRFWSPYFVKKSGRRDSRLNQRTNPNLLFRRLCWGCCSSDHLLRDKKCTLSHASIRTNFVDGNITTPDQAHVLAKKLLILHATFAPIHLVERKYRSSAKHTITLTTANKTKTQMCVLVNLYTIQPKQRHINRVLTQNSPSIHSTPCVFSIVHILFSLYSHSPQLTGFCLGLGAPRSVVGQKELHKKLSCLGSTDIPIAKSQNFFRFSDIAMILVGKLELCLEIPDQVPIIIALLDIVSDKVPTLLGLEVLDAEKLCTDNVTNRLVCRQPVSRSDEDTDYAELSSVLIIRHDGHLYSGMSFPPSNFYTSSQLR